MAYDEKLADRIRRVVGSCPDVTEKRMFGGIAFLLDGKMFCGIVKDDLMVRVGPNRYEAALAKANVRPMDFTGRPMSGYVFVGPSGCRTQMTVKKWVDQGAAFVETLETRTRSTAKKATKYSAGPHLNAAWHQRYPMPKNPTADPSMTRYALLLRGVNVGTKNSLPMAELREMLTKLGCTDVQTYVQSGNAVFATKVGEGTLTKVIEDVLERHMGRPIATTLRTLGQVRAIVDANPFSKVAKEPKYLCVTFLSHAPTKAEVAPLHAQDWKPELFEVADREIYTWHPNGQGRSPLAAALGKLPLRGAVTTRNWNTVVKLLEMLDG